MTKIPIETIRAACADGSKFVKPTTGESSCVEEELFASLKGLEELTRQLRTVLQTSTSSEQDDAALQIAYHTRNQARLIMHWLGMWAQFREIYGWHEVGEKYM